MVALVLRNPHPWDLAPKDAIALQRELAGKVVIEPFTSPVRLIAAADVAFKGGDAVAAVCLFDYPSLELLESRCVRQPCRMPYIPGLLTFREGPALLAAFEKLSKEPDVILFDGQGTAHPRGMGIASHMGVLFDRPAIGCAKSWLCGEPERELPPQKGAWVRLLDRGKVIGAVVRSRDNVKPLYVSVGHRVGLEQAVGLVLSCCVKYRIPVPLSVADKLSKNPVYT